MPQGSSEHKVGARRSPSLSFWLQTTGSSKGVLGKVLVDWLDRDREREVGS